MCRYNPFGIDFATFEQGTHDFHFGHQIRRVTLIVNRSKAIENTFS